MRNHRFFCVFQKKEKKIYNKLNSMKNRRYNYIALRKMQQLILSRDQGQLFKPFS